MNKIFYWLAALIVIAVVVIGLTRDKSANTSQDSTSSDKQAADAQSAESSSLEVVYDGKSFVPATLTISAGQSVTFKNTSSDLMWVASNPHPIHSDHSEFNANRGYSSSENFTFTFASAGTYGFHNHLNPAVAGSITVK
jgi:plastocyanin